jgi:acetyl-CoA synthetase
MVGAGTSCKYLFDLRPGDVYWCTADCGWITGHTYVTYGPLLCGVTNVLFGSTPAYPDASRCWRIVEKYGVSAWQRRGAPAVRV